MWFMSNEQQTGSLGDELMSLEPITKRRIIGGVLSCSTLGEYYLTPKYIESVKHKHELSKKKIRVCLNQASVFDEEVVAWIERVTGQKCHRAKYDVTGNTKWDTGLFYLNKRGQSKRKGNSEKRKANK